MLLTAVLAVGLSGFTSIGTAFAAAPEAPPAQTVTKCANPDVVLDVPNLSVKEIKVDVQDLKAHLNLDARVSSLVTLTAGVDASLGKLTLDIKDVQAEAHLRVCLDDVVKIVDRTLTTVDKNPQLLTGLLNSVSGLLNQTVNSLGQTVQRTLDSTGNIVERTVDQAGNIVGQQVVGNISSLQVVNTTTNALGQTVKQVRDTSGALIEVVQDASGNIVSTRVLSQATGATAS